MSELDHKVNFITGIARGRTSGQAAAGREAYELPSVDDVVVRAILLRQAASHPDEVFLSFEDGSSWTRKDALEQACGAAERLAQAGVQQGDRVALLLENGPGFLHAWYGAAMLGATVVPLSTAFRGTILAHAFRLAEPCVLLSTPEVLAATAEAGVLDVAGTQPLDVSELDRRSSVVPELASPQRVSDVAVMLMTSGTTGPSKLAINTALHTYLGGSWFLGDQGLGREDTLLLDLPLYHGAAFWWHTTCLSTGCHMVIRSGPSMRSYWKVARDHGITLALLLSTMVPFLLQQDVDESESQHSIRLMVSTPPPKDLASFQERFAISAVTTGYGLTEVPTPIVGHPDDEVVGSYCGRARTGYECRLVDDNDLEVPVGEPGELIVRADHPWMITPGYVQNVEATASAWRNGWFHTGDMLRTDAEGRFFFVDRIKDALRRRGENISSSEVEAEMRAFPGVLEAACVPHRDEDSVEDEVKVFLVSNGEIDFVKLLEFAVARMPYFMVPRYFELIDEIPKTHSMRYKKFELRQLGTTSRTWDRETNGFRVTRRGLERPA